MQPESQSNVLRQQKYFQLVQSNSQYFTVIRKSLSQNSGKDAQSLGQYLKNLTDVKIDYQNFAQCFIQITYMIYTTKYYGLNPHIDEQSVRIQQNYNWMNEKRFSIIIYYRFNQQLRDTSTYSSIIKDIYKYLKISYEQYQNKIKQKIKQTSIDTDPKSCLKTFFQQIHIIQQILKDQTLSNNQNNFFILLQETDLFRQNSMLLKIKNNSMLDYLKCKFMKFKNFKQIDTNLTNQYISQKKKNKSDLQQLKKKQKQIQENITNFFQQIVETNPNKFKLKLEPNQYFKTRFIFIVQDLMGQPFTNRIAKLGYNLDFSNMQFQQNNNQQFYKQRTAPFMEYQIQYNSQRNSICVRLIMSSIACSNQSTDYIMFQSNVLTFESANISLEFIQDRGNVKSSSEPKGNEKSSMEDKAKQNNQQRKRNLAFRGASCFNNKEPILQKILTLMDLTMIAAKICEPQLISMKKNFMADKDPRKLSIVYQKLNHYTKVFLKCAKKIYNQ